METEISPMLSSLSAENDEKYEERAARLSLDVDVCSGSVVAGATGDPAARISRIQSNRDGYAE